MKTLSQQGVWDLARASSAAGKIIEAHSDHHDQICRVVVEINESLRNVQLREAILQLWSADGFMASVSRDGMHLFVDGIIGQEHTNNMDLVAAVAHQIKTYTQRAMQQAAATDLTGGVPMVVQALGQVQGEGAAL